MNPYTAFLAELVEAWIIPHLLPALAVVGVALAALSLIWIAASAVRVLGAVIPKLIGAALVLGAGLVIGFGILNLFGR